jgi:hypothetical protein
MPGASDAAGRGPHALPRAEAVAPSSVRPATPRRAATARHAEAGYDAAPGVPAGPATAGTRQRPAAAGRHPRALRSRPRPDVIVALTDGQTPWPADQPLCRTVVGLFPRPSRRVREDDPGYVPDAPPDWARVVTIG